MNNDTTEPALLTKTKEFLESINRFAWNADYIKFCETLDLEINQYSEEKYQQFRELINYLNCFDPESLTKILEAGK